MSWDSLTPYVTVWMWTRAFKPVKDSAVETLLNVSIKAVMFQNFKRACLACVTTFQTKNQTLGFIFSDDIHAL